MSTLVTVWRGEDQRWRWALAGRSSQSYETVGQARSAVQRAMRHAQITEQLSGDVSLEVEAAGDGVDWQATVAERDATLDRLAAELLAARSAERDLRARLAAAERQRQGLEAAPPRQVATRAVERPAAAPRAKGR